MQAAQRLYKGGKGDPPLLRDVFIDCEGGAAGPPFGVVKPNKVFVLGPAYSRSPCPLTRPLRLTTTVTDPDPSEPKYVPISYFFVAVPCGACERAVGHADVLLGMVAHALARFVS